MTSSSLGARLGVAAALIIAGSCLAVLGAGAAEDRRVLATQPGHDAPDFVLPVAAAPAATRCRATSVPGDTSAPPPSFRLADYRGRTVVLYFCAAGCPVSNDYERRVADLADQHAAGGRVAVVAVHTGSAAAPAAEVAVQARAAGLRFAHVTDPGGAVARQYAVRQTPTILVIDPAGTIRYRGAFDDNRNPAQATEAYAADGVRAVLAGRPVARPVTQVVGCPVR
jgi:peroxiredoxin